MPIESPFYFSGRRSALVHSNLQDQDLSWNSLVSFNDTADISDIFIHFKLKAYLRILMHMITQIIARCSEAYHLTLIVGIYLYFCYDLRIICCSKSPVEFSRLCHSAYSPPEERERASYVLCKLSRSRLEHLKKKNNLVFNPSPHSRP